MFKSINQVAQEDGDTSLNMARGDGQGADHEYSCPLAEIGQEEEA